MAKPASPASPALVSLKSSPTVNLKSLPSSEVPVAELRRAFTQSVGLGPVDWLRRQRFDGARRELRAAAEDTTVTAVAMKWGFVHLGRFSTGYAARFGETPSATLRAARGR